MKNRMRGMAVLLCAMVLGMVCFGCSRANGESTAEEQSRQSVQEKQYTVEYPIEGTAGLCVGVINPETERPQYAILEYMEETRDYRTLVVFQSGTPHYEVCGDTLYYFHEGTGSLLSFPVQNPDRQDTVISLGGGTDGEARYIFVDFIRADDDWIYLKAEKWGTNEDGYEVFLPGYYLAVRQDGSSWKEITENELPKEDS